MGSVMHLSEGHRSDMLLELSGLTREERVMVQASINNECDFDKVADARIILHPCIHLRESRKRSKGKGRDGIKSSDARDARRSVGSQNKICQVKYLFQVQMRR